MKNIFIIPLIWGTSIVHFPKKESFFLSERDSYKGTDKLVKASLKDGTYELVNPSSCCGTSDLKLCLRIKSYLANRYYITLASFRENTMHHGCISCLGTYLVEWKPFHTKILYKQDLELDSVHIEVKSADCLNIQHFSKVFSRNQQLQFKYVSEKMYPLFDNDVYNGFYFIPKFSGKIKMRCYDYPDKRASSSIFTFAANGVVQVASVQGVPNENQDFFLLYFNPKDETLNGDYDNYKHHLWVRKEDLLKFFIRDTEGRI
jgi:hypothetical protein